MPGSSGLAPCTTIPNRVYEIWKSKININFIIDTSAWRNQYCSQTSEHLTCYVNDPQNVAERTKNMESMVFLGIKQIGNNKMLNCGRVPTAYTDWCGLQSKETPMWKWVCLIQSCGTVTSSFLKVTIEDCHTCASSFMAGNLLPFVTDYSSCQTDKTVWLISKNVTGQNSFGYQLPKHSSFPGCSICMLIWPGTCKKITDFVALSRRHN